MRFRSLYPMTAVIAGVLLASHAYAAGKLVFVSLGGTYQAAQEAARAKPFAAQEKVELITDSSALSYAKIKVMVSAKDIQWDVVEVVASEYVNLVKDGLVEEIDYSKFDAQTLKAIPEQFRPKHGVGAVMYAYGIGYRTDRNGAKHPTNLKEFWDLKNFPGARVVPSGKSPVPPWEAALLADGVPADKLYPIDFDRAIKSLDKVKGGVRLWFDDIASGAQALISGDVDYGWLPNGRVLQAKAQGAKVDFDYGNSFLYTNYFVIPKGAKNKENAMKFMAFASTAKPSADLMKALPYSTPNTDALKLLDPAYAETLPTSPKNLARVIPMNGAFYGEQAGSGRTWQQVGLQKWNAWYGR